MGKRPYYKTSGLGGVFVAIGIGMIGLIGYFISHYGFVLIPIFLAFYLYVKYSSDSETKTKSSVNDLEENNESKLIKTAIDKEKNNLEKIEELNNIQWWESLNESWKKIFNHYADKKQMFENDKGIRPVNYTSFFYPVPDSKSIQNLSIEIPNKVVLNKQIILRKDLNLQLCYSDDFNIKPIERLINLEYLILPLFYSLNNADIKVIQNLDNLKYLDLNVKPDCDIKVLSELKNLELLNISINDDDTQNLNSIEYLREELPNCRIVI